MTQHPERLLERPAIAGDVTALDVMSDVLRSVRLTGSMLFLVEATTPWMTQAPRTSAFARAVMPAAQHLISYHVITEGTCWGGLAGEMPQPMRAGDILVVPHGDPYFLAAPRDAPQMYGDEEAVSFFRRMAAGELPAVVKEGGGGAEKTNFICGFLGCDSRPFNPILAALPRVIHLHRASPARDQLGRLIQVALAELRTPRAGAREILLRLSELMFVEVVRSYLASAPGDRHDWLVGLRDPLVARALACLHGQPAYAWTLKALAASSNTSRTTLAERFVQYIGQPPMQYLTAWRMQLATRQLSDSTLKVGSVAVGVGYKSEAAFSRAFKKHTGSTPSEWRKR